MSELCNVGHVETYEAAETSTVRSELSAVGVRRRGRMAINWVISNRINAQIITYVRRPAGGNGSQS
jgi:hypothetical protein